MNEVEALYKHGVKLYDEGDIDGAFEAYEKALVLNPSLASAHNGRGAVLTARGQRAEAMKEFELAIQLDPNLGKARNGRGVLLVRNGQTKEALAEFSLAIELDPGLSESYLNRGRLYLETGNADAAKIDFENSLLRIPDSSRGIAIKGNCFLELKRYDEAIAEYDRCIEKNYIPAEMLVMRGVAKKRAGRLDEADQDFLLSISIDPKLAIAHANRAEILRSKAQMREAIRAYEEAVRLQPENVEFRCEVAWMLYGERVYEIALLHFDVAESLAPKNGRVLSGKANCLDSMGQPMLAIDALRRCIEVDYCLDWAYGRRAAIYLKQNHLEEALADCEASLAIKDTNYWVHDILANALSKLWKFDRAFTVCNQAIEAEPEQASHYVTRGKVHVRKLDPQNGLIDFTRAIELDPKCYSAYSSRAKLYESLNESAKAIEDWNVAFEIWPNPQITFRRDRLMNRLAVDGRFQG